MRSRPFQPPLGAAGLRPAPDPTQRAAAARTRSRRAWGRRAWTPVHGSIGALAALVWGLAASAAVPVPVHLVGQVIRVDDGDTLELLDASRRRWTIRLSDVDAPERAHGARRPGQPYAARATQHVKAIALQQQASARCFDVDLRERERGTPRPRFVCQVKVGGADLAASLLDAGLAMAYRQNVRFIRDPQTLAREAAARSARRGLWNQSEPVPPWVWRQVCWQQGRCPASPG